MKRRLAQMALILTTLVAAACGIEDGPGDIGADFDGVDTISVDLDPAYGVVFVDGDVCGDPCELDTLPGDIIDFDAELDTKLDGCFVGLPAECEGSLPCGIESRGGRAITITYEPDAGAEGCNEPVDHGLEYLEVGYESVRPVEL